MVSLLKTSNHFLFFQTRFVMNFFFHKKLKTYSNNLVNLSFLFVEGTFGDLANLNGLFLPEVSVTLDYIKIQELTFLSEYFLVTALFCLTLFALFSIKLVTDEKHFFIKFQYDNQLIFLLIFVLTCYLILIYQQIDLSLLAVTSFNDTIYNDHLSFISKLVIGLSSIFYLIFTTQYLKEQKLSNFEYYIILLTSIFGFFLLCGANDLITAYLAIELQGLAFYVLASFKKSSNFSIESGVKYFVLGSLSTALFLLGITFIYGLSGTILLSDLKDFFIWVFSTNSFFLSFDSIQKALESFQEKTYLNEDSDTSKLHLMLNKLELLKKKAHFLPFELESLKLNFNDSNLGSDNLEKIEVCNSILVNMTEHCNQINPVDEIFFKTNIITSSTSDFLIESNFQSSFVQLLNVSQEKTLTYDDFINFKNHLLEANFYYDTDIEKFYELGTETLKDDSSNFFQMNGACITNYCFSSVYHLLNCCFLFKSIDNAFLLDILLQNDNDSLETLSLDKDFLGEFSNQTSIINNIDVRLENLVNSHSYIYSIINIFNFSNLFLEPVNVSNVDSKFMFDFSFATFGMLIIILALFFKLALAPFHLWAPDVYEGSPSSSTFFFMIISKFSIFVFLLRICYLSFYSLISYWQFYSLLVATISIFIGAVAGLKQRRLKSLLTYSSINNMGFVLLAFSIGSFEGIQVQFFYLLVYMLSGLCIWSIILNLNLKKKSYFEKLNRDLGDLALLQESNNTVAQNLGITLFTLAGLPPMVGFLAKMGVFKALTGVSIYFFSITNILFSVIATFYYLRITKIIFFENLLVGNLYVTLSSKKTFLINLLTFLLVFLFVSPMFLYLYSYKIILLLNKSFY